MVCTLSFQVSGAEKGAKHTQAEYAAAYALLEAMQLPALLKQPFDGLVEIQLRAAPQLMPYKWKMVPFYGTVYKSSLYDLIIPFPACESGAKREKRRAVVFASGKIGKSE